MSINSRILTRTFSVTSRSKFLFAALTTAALSPLGAAAQEECSPYTVKAGDSLGSIALSAYGSFDYQMIFNANRDAIGGTANSLVVGTVLQLPCADGRLTENTELSAIIEEQEAKQAAVGTSTNVYEPPIKIVTGTGWEPFASEELQGGGFLVRLAATALNRGGNNRDYNISFVNDWGSHLETLLPLGLMDVSIAWYRPDCTKLDLLSDSMRARCTELDTTVPVYETVVGYFTLADSKYANAESFEAYKGARVCRPEGWYTFDFEEEGLNESNIEYIRPFAPSDCMEALLVGTADVVGLELETAYGALAEMGSEQDIVENPNLSKFLSLHFVAHKTNPRGRVYIAMLNRGLNEMRETGEWYDIVASSLKEYNDRQQATN